MFVHLHLHTEYSLVDSVVRITSEGDGIPGLMDSAARLGMPAIALTDQCNLFGMVKFYKAALAAGVKPIVGVDLLVREPGERVEPSATRAAVSERGRLQESPRGSCTRVSGRSGGRAS